MACHATHSLVIACVPLPPALQKLGIGRGDVVAVTPAQYSGIRRQLACDQRARRRYANGAHAIWVARTRTSARPQRRQRHASRWRVAKDRSPAEDIHKLRGKLPALRHIISVRSEAPGCERFEAAAAHDLAPPSSFRRGVGRRRFYAALHLRHDILAKSGLGDIQSFPQQCAHVRGRVRHNARTTASFVLRLTPTSTGSTRSSSASPSAATACLLVRIHAGRLRQALSRPCRPTMLFAGPAHIAPCLQQGTVRQRRPLALMRVAVLSGSTVPGALFGGLRGCGCRTARCCRPGAWPNFIRRLQPAQD